MNEYMYMYRPLRHPCDIEILKFLSKISIVTQFNTS